MSMENSRTHIIFYLQTKLSILLVNFDGMFIIGRKLIQRNTNSRNILRVRRFHTVKRTVLRLRKFSHIFCKNFVKTTALQKKLLKNQFHKIFWGLGKFRVFPHCETWITEFRLWKLREFSLTHFWQKFRENSGITKCIMHW